LDELSRKITVLEQWALFYPPRFKTSDKEYKPGFALVDQ
jgi:hypothetical protein